MNCHVLGVFSENVQNGPVFEREPPRHRVPSADIWSKTERDTDGRTDGQTDGQTTDRRTENLESSLHNRPKGNKNTRHFFAVETLVWTSNKLDHSVLHA